MKRIKNKANKQEVLDLLAKIFSNGTNNLILVHGYGYNYASSFEYAFDEDEDEVFDTEYYLSHLKKTAYYSNKEYSDCIVFYDNYSDENVIVLSELLPELDEDDLITLCARESIGNDLWDAVVCIDAEGDIVIHQVRDDGMISSNKAVIYNLNDYAK